MQKSFLRRASMQNASSRQGNWASIYVQGTEVFTSRITGTACKWRQCLPLFVIFLSQTYVDLQECNNARPAGGSRTFLPTRMPTLLEIAKALEHSNEILQTLNSKLRRLRRRSPNKVGLRECKGTCSPLISLTASLHPASGRRIASLLAHQFLKKRPPNSSVVDAPA